MNYGNTTPSMVGLAMKEMVRRAIREIRNQRFVFDASHKASLDDGSMTDLVTTADLAAQKIYLRVIKNCFPDYGVIAEEEELRVPCQAQNRNLCFTIDPLDGTKAFARRQSAGVGTMIALLDNRNVLSAYVGDVMTQEIYGFRPESHWVYRISEYDVAESLQKAEVPIEKAYLLLRDQPKNYPPSLARMIDRFCGVDVEGGSIGISFARLWKREVEAILTGFYFATPWDSAPIIGISRKLGYRFAQIDPDGTIREIELQPPLEPAKNDHYLLVAGDQVMRELGLP